MRAQALQKEKEILSYQVAEKPQLSDRVQRLKSSFNEAEVRTSVERAKCLLEVYRKAGGESAIMTRAKVLDRYLRGIFTLMKTLLSTLLRNFGGALIHVRNMMLQRQS